MVRHEATKYVFYLKLTRENASTDVIGEICRQLRELRREHLENRGGAWHGVHTLLLAFHEGMWKGRDLPGRSHTNKNN